MKSIKKIVIVGLGLMGGSLAAAIRKQYPRIRVVGVARRKATLAFARRKKWIHEGFLSVEQAVRGADFAVICTPVNKTADFLKRIDGSADQEIFVTDVGSVKSPICSFSKNKKWKYVRFIGAHPMFGSHEKGIEHASGHLYGKGLTIITAAPSLPGFSRVRNFWKSFSGKVITMDPLRHDALVAEVSHLPHLLSACLMQTATPAARQIAAKGFRDNTRLAEGVPTVWAPIFSQNRKATLRAIQSFKHKLRQFENLLNSNNINGLEDYLEHASRSRKTWGKSATA